MEAITYSQAAKLLGIDKVGTIRTAAMRNNLTKVPTLSQEQLVIKEQVLLFKGKKQIRMASLPDNEKALWFKYKEAAENHQQNNQKQPHHEETLIDIASQLGLSFSSRSIEKVVKETHEIISELDDQIREIYQKTYLDRDENLKKISDIEAAVKELSENKDIDTSNAIEMSKKTLETSEKIIELGTLLIEEMSSVLEKRQKLQSMEERLQTILKIIPLIEKPAQSNSSAQLEEITR